MARRSYTSKSVDASFDLDGVEFTPAYFSMLDLAELAQFADMDIDTPAGMARVQEFFAAILGGDYERFRAHCKAHRTDADTLMAIIQDTFVEILGFPTERPSDSSDGTPGTEPTLRVISPSEGTVVQLPLTPQRAAELRAAVEAAEAAQAQALTG